jgi:K+-transporting ATPase KdpF subunit
MITFITSLIVVSPAATTAGTNPEGYIIGAVISLLILLYLVYSLIHPEKF